MTADADAAEGDGAEGGNASSRGARKRIVLIALGVIVAVSAVGAGVYFTGVLEKSPTLQSGGPLEEQKPVVFYDLPEMTVNLATEGRATYLKVRIALEVGDRTTIDRIEPYLPRILDAFQVYLRELRPADLEGSSGLFRLKEELLRRINTAVYPARVDGVLFKEILVQ